MTCSELTRPAQEAWVGGDHVQQRSIGEKYLLDVLGRNVLTLGGDGSENYYRRRCNKQVCPCPELGAEWGSKEGGGDNTLIVES